MTRIRVQQPGLCTTVQDLGRPHHASLGVPPSGAADQLALTAANRLLNNHDNAAAFECTLTGPTLTFEAPTHIVLAAAESAAAHIATPTRTTSLTPFTPTPVREGDTLTIKSTGARARAYICIAGGIDVPPILDSRSTLITAQLGGHQGRPLRQGDTLTTPQSTQQPAEPNPHIAEWLRQHTEHKALRITPALHTAAFPSHALTTITSSTFTVSPQSNRVGIRLQGTHLPTPAHADTIESEPTVTGAIQIPPGGNPIILSVDRPTTGGYPILACVIQADHPATASLKPNDQVTFQPVTKEQARSLYNTQRSELDDLIPPATQSNSP